MGWRRLTLPPALPSPSQRGRPSWSLNQARTDAATTPYTTLTHILLLPARAIKQLLLMQQVSLGGMLPPPDTISSFLDGCSTLLPARAGHQAAAADAGGAARGHGTARRRGAAHPVLLPVVAQEPAADDAAARRRDAVLRHPHPALCAPGILTSDASAVPVCCETCLACSKVEPLRAIVPQNAVKSQLAVQERSRQTPLSLVCTPD